MEDDGPDAKEVELVLGPINAAIFKRIQQDATQFLAIPVASSGRGNKPKGSTREQKLYHALDLIERCRRGFVPPPIEVVALLSEAAGRELERDRTVPDLSEQQWRFVEILLASPSLTLFGWKDEALPIKLSARQVAKKMEVAPATIMNWWRSNDVRRGLTLRISESLCEELKSETV